MSEHILFSFLQCLLVVSVVSGYLKWLRARSSDARERMEFKNRLAPWVKLFELTIFAIFLVVILLVFVKYSISLYRLIHIGVGPNDVAQGLLIMPPVIISGILALLLTNVVSWIIPQVRKANESAMQGLAAASYKRSMRDLFLILAWLLPACLIFWTAGLLFF